MRIISGRQNIDMRPSPPELSKETIEKLSDIFYSDDFGMRSAVSLYRQANKQGINISHSDLRRGFYDLQEVVQMFAPLKKPQSSGKPIIATFTGEKIYMDTMYFPKNKLAVINAFDLHSKYAWGKPVRLKTRADETTESVSSLKTKNFLEEVIADLHKNGFTLEEVVSDFGSEFLGNFAKYVAENNIEHLVTEVGDHILMSPIDAYTRGLRLSAEKWLAVNEGQDLYKQIPKLIKLYNNTEHSTTGMKPSEALGKIIPVPQKKPDMRKASELLEGDSVRIVIRYDKNPFKKIRPNWSREMYKVVKANYNSRRFTLDNGRTYREHDLLLVPFPEKVMRPKIPLSSPTGLRPEGAISQEISASPEAKKDKTPPPPRRSQREVKKPKYLIDFL